MNNPPPPLPPGNTPAPPKRSPIGGVLVTLGILFIAFLGFRIVQFALHVKEHPLQRKPGEEELLRAAKLTVGSNRGFAHGNTAEAQSLAERLSRMMKVIRETMFKGGNPDSIEIKLLTKGEFLVFCQLDDESCAFVIHVPEMRRYTSEAKESVAELAYVAAAAILDSAEKKGVQRLAVATRGDILYDRVLIGDYQFESKDPLHGARKAPDKGALAPSLYPFFTAKKE